MLLIHLLAGYGVVRCGVGSCTMRRRLCKLGISFRDYALCFQVVVDVDVLCLYNLNYNTCGTNEGRNWILIILDIDFLKLYLLQTEILAA